MTQQEKDEFNQRRKAQLQKDNKGRIIGAVITAVIGLACFLQAPFGKRGVRTKSWTKIRSITGGDRAHVFLRRAA